MKHQYAKKLLGRAFVACLIALALACIFTACQKSSKDKAQNDKVCAHVPGDWIVTNKSSCTSEGWIIKKCTKCEMILFERVVRLLPHSRGDLIVDKEPTLTEEGRSHISCTVCNSVMMDVIVFPLSIHHEHTSDPDAEEITSQPTCTTRGRWKRSCDICNWILDGGTLPRLDHIESDWIVDTPAKIGEAGMMHIECTECQTVLRRREIPALESEHQHVAGEWTTSKAASCIETGVEVQNCSLCGEELERREIGVSDHIEGNWITEIPAQVGVAGKKLKRCTVCKTALKTEEIPALPPPLHRHVAGEWIVSLEPSCTKVGFRERYCTECKEKIEIGMILATGHTESEWIVENEASGSVDGRKYKKCTVCQKVTQIEIIPVIPLPSNTAGFETIDHTGVCPPATEALEADALYSRDPDGMTGPPHP